MSENDGGQSSDEQNDQQQGESPPQGQPPQGGQPQGGQPPQQPPQGGQPPQQPPQGGQPPQQPPQGGQPPRQPPQGGENELLKQWAQYVTVLFAMAGAGIGLFILLVNAIEEPLLEPDGAGLDLGFMLDVLILPAFYFGIFAGPFIGAYFATKLSEPDNEVFKIAGACVAAGTLALAFLAGFLGGITVDDTSINFAGLLINSILAAIVAGGVAAGGVWARRNQHPEYQTP